MKDFGNNLFEKIITIILLIMLFQSSTPFGIMCSKCWEKDHIRCIANRSIADETSGDKRAVYRCQYGHVIYVDWEERKSAQK